MGYTGNQSIHFFFYDLAAKEYAELREWTFMNYGYANLNESTETHNLNHFEALYAQVVGCVPLDGLNVLEIGCGRGGGAAYVSRVCHPRSLIGVDHSPHCIQFCSRNHSIQGLQFLNADASDLPFHTGTFDAVINIESSHCYPNENTFLQSVARVLKPDGFFLFADFRLRYLIPALLKKFADAGLKIITETDISKNVLHALNLDSPMMAALIRKHFPAPLQPLFLTSAAVVGTTNHMFFSTGLLRYVHFVARKQQ